MDLPETGVVPALRVPERVNCWLRAGLALLVVMVRVVDVVVTALVETDESPLTPSWLLA
jgi:hypothetical protein